MKPHQRRLFDSLTCAFRQCSDKGAEPQFVGLLNQWISQDTVDRDILGRDHIDSICRAIDVSKKIPFEFVAGQYGVGSGAQPEGSVATALVALLLAHASSPTAEHGGRLKCANTALKLIDMTPQLAERNRVLAWAHECVERLLSEAPTW